jgi:transcriptional regulator with XRE-family HTH domain
MLSQIVRDLRTKNQITGRDLARKIGKNDTWVSQIETGKIVHPDLPAFKKMLRFLGCTDEQIAEIILNEFKETDKHPKYFSKNKTDYKIEKTLILSHTDRKEYGNVEFKSFRSKVMTENEYIMKCEKDAHQLYVELKLLPQPTLDKLTEFLFEDM